MYRLMAALVMAAPLLGLTGCSGESETVATVMAPTQSVAPIPTPSHTTTPAPTERDFVVVGYSPSTKEGEWENRHSTGLPVLIVERGRLTAFRLSGITCRVALLLKGQPLLPGQVITMAITAEADGLKPGKFYYTIGGVRVGKYDCA